MENNLSNLELDRGSGSQKGKLEGVDLKNVTVNDVTNEGIASGFLDAATNWVAINNVTNSGITGEEANKTLDELGFKDGDTIRFVAKGTAAAINSMIISGGNTPGMTLAESQQILRNVGFTNENINFLAPKMTVLDKLAYRKLRWDTTKREWKVCADHQIAGLTKASERELKKIDIFTDFTIDWLKFTINTYLAVNKAGLTTEAVKRIKQICDNAIIGMQNDFNKCVMEIQRQNECMKAIHVDWLKKPYEDSIRNVAESLFRNQQLVVAEVVSILQQYGITTPNTLHQLN